MRAVRSSLSQQGVNLEVVVVLDGQCTVSSAALRAIRDPRLTVWEIQEQQGRGFARQAGLRRCRGEYVTFVDADDWLMPGKLGVQLALLQSGACDVVSTSMYIADGDGQLRGVRIYDSMGSGLGPKGELPDFPFAPMMVSRILLTTVGFDPSLTSGEDREMLYRLIRHVRWRVLSLPLYVYDEYSHATFEKQEASAALRAQLAAAPDASLAKRRSARRAQLLLPVLRGLYAAGFGDLHIRLRSRRPTPEQRADYANARSLLLETLALAPYH